MHELPGYTITGTIVEDTGLVLCRALSERIPSGQRSVFIKMQVKDAADAQQDLKLRNEYEITRNVSTDGVLKPLELVRHRNITALILEDFNGTPLSDLIHSKKIDPMQFLHIAHRLSVILGDIHGNSVLHLGLRPRIILVHDDMRQVKLTGFGDSMILSPAGDIPSGGVEKIKGTLAYLSPELTGRMDRSVDLRSDLYSLGVVFYEMLTGVPPFRSEDPLELLHCHIAVNPVPPQDLDGRIPHALSLIVLKLLLKAPEDRYQSSFGLRMDLERCVSMLQTAGTISSFQPGEHDRSPLFRVSGKIYGRQAALSSLKEAYGSACSGERPFVLITGGSGIGKTYLVRSFRASSMDQKKWYISGKCERLQQGVPYGGFIQAFRELIGQILTKSEESVRLWKERMLEALGPNGRIIIDVIPQAALIIGPQKPVPALPARETQNRFAHVFQNFVKVFCAEEYPLVIFLDDLQWVDTASLHLMRILASSPDLKYLLFIGAYRDAEVNSQHPLTVLLNDLHEQRTSLAAIHLEPMHREQVESIVSDTLECERERSRAVAHVIFEKTGGNPLFIHELLKTLYRKKQIYFDFQSGRWDWNLDTILKTDVADDLIRFVKQKIQRLTAPGRRMLKHAACIGTCFTLGMLAQLLRIPPFDALEQLGESLEEGLILPPGDKYSRTSVSEESRSELENLTYTFLHDRVQQVAYSLLSAKQKRHLHLKIGTMMLGRTEKAQLDERICEIVDHLNRGSALIEERHEKYELAGLNLAAGKKAKASVAYRSAMEYVQAGLDMLPYGCWSDRYDLTLSLYVEGAETAYLNGDFTRAEEYNGLVLEHAHTLLDQVRAYETIIQSNIAQAKYREAVDVASGVLNQLGVFLPRNPGRLRILLGLLRTKMVLHGAGFDYLSNLPRMTDEYKLAAMRILMSVFNPFYKTIREMFPSITYRMIILSFKYGNSSFSPFSYSLYGLLLVLIGEIGPGYQFAHFGLDLFGRYYTRELASKMYNVHYAIISKWKSHMKEALAPLLEAYQNGLETGDLEWAAHAVRSYCLQLFFTGSSIERVTLETERYGRSMKKINQESTLRNLMLLRQSAMNLSGAADTRTELRGESFNEEEMLQVLIDAHDTDTRAGMRFHKCMLCYLFGEHAKALEIFREIEKQHETRGQFGFVLEVRFYYSLVILCSLSSLKKADRKRSLQSVTSFQKMMRTGAEHAPMNYLHKWRLVEAERERLLGRELNAMKLYDQAIAGARENGYTQDEALANELAARFYLEMKKRKIAGTYLREAHACYGRWGAFAKTRDLEQRFGELILPPSEGETSGYAAAASATDSPGIRPLELDLATVLKSSRVISGEIVMSSLLKRIMKIVMEVSGAGRGLLILEREGEFFIEAEGNAAEGTILLLEDEKITASPKLSHSVFNFVIRTRENVVLRDACVDERFSSDRYIRRRRPRSLLAAPILHQGLIKGLIYLENNLTSGAFTDDRVEILSLIALQAAVSLENARLYDSLLEDIERRKAVEEELRRSEQLARSLLDALKDSLVLIDPEGRILSLNRTTCRNFGVSSEQIMGMYLWDLYSPEIAKKRRDRVHRAVVTVKAIRVVDEQEGKISDTVIYPVIDSEGKVSKIAILERDITERKKVEAQVKMQQLQLLRSDRLAMMGELAAGVAHEINNPNHSILLNTAILMRAYPDILSVLDDYCGTDVGFRIGGFRYDDFKKTFEDSVRQIDECSRRIGMIVKELKGYAGPGPEKEKEAVDLNIAVQSAILLGTPLVKKSTDNFTVQLEQNIPRVRGNLLKIEQVVLNLMQNACQSLPDRSRGVFIGTSHDSSLRRVILTVRDEGVGMPGDLLSKIREPFFTTRRGSGGTGLGLSICSRIVEEHGGSLSIRSEPGKGTEVTVGFPEGELK